MIRRSLLPYLKNIWIGTKTRFNYFSSLYQIHIKMFLAAIHNLKAFCSSSQRQLFLFKHDGYYVVPIVFEPYQIDICKAFNSYMTIVYA